MSIQIDPFDVRIVSISRTPRRARVKTERAAKVIETRKLTEEETAFIVDQADKKKIDLSAAGLPDLNKAEITVHEQDLFTVVSLWRYEEVDEYDEDQGNNWWVKIGVTKRTANEEHDPVRAKNIALWRAVLAPSIF